ncbi:MAG: hypothetical protein JXA69_01295 [Phycisphaerae bacterium]|nr:hypothetical protein [Phycisphaerae bacterium]
MTDWLSTIFLHPLEIGGWQCGVLLWPLCLAVSIIYKTTKCGTVREIPLASLILWVTIVVGMYAVGAALLIIYRIAT